MVGGQDMLRARVSDPAGPRRWRTATTLAPLVPAAVALPFDGTAGAALVAVAIAWMFVAGLLRPRLRARDATIIVEGRAIRIRNAGLVSQRIRAQDVVAAATGHGDRGFILALVREAPRDRPLVLQLAREPDATRIRRALGIGAGGFGTVSWPGPADGESWVSMTLRLLVAFGWLLLAWATLHGPFDVAAGLLFLISLLSVAVLGWLASGGTRLTGPTADELVQAMALAQSAEGRAAPAGATPTGMAPLACGETEDSVGWLQRLDAMAASLVESDGYRGGGVDRTELWETLEDPDAPPAVRAASARLLARIAPEEAPRRISDALAVERDGATRARIRIALEEDVQTAARGLERLTSR
jgi:hypothetical protein